MTNNLVQPASVFPSHANGVATKGGKVLPGTRTETFKNAVEVPVHVPLSGKSIEFDNNGKSVAGC